MRGTQSACQYYRLAVSASYQECCQDRLGRSQHVASIVAATSAPRCPPGVDASRLRLENLRDSGGVDHTSKRRQLNRKNVEQYRLNHSFSMVNDKIISTIDDVRRAQAHPGCSEQKIAHVCASCVQGCRCRHPCHKIPSAMKSFSSLQQASSALQLELLFARWPLAMLSLS